MGAVAGYVAAKVSKIWNSEEQEGQWKLMTILTTLLFPGITFIVFFMLNLLIWKRRTSGAVPFATMFSLLVLWFGFSVPLVFLGAYIAVRKNRWSSQCKLTIFHVNFLNNSSCRPQGFCVFSVALCHFVLCTRKCSSSCLPCGNISFMISSVS